MTRRSIPQAKLDEGAFPTRIKVIVPGFGFRGLDNGVDAWPDEHAGRGNYAIHPAATYAFRCTR